jgi:hypothetical protein
MEHVNFAAGVSATTQAEIEALLSEVAAEIEVIPTDRRGEFIDEMRAHLYAMLAARVSDGLSEAVAWKQTQAAFGEGTEIGRDLAEEWIRKPRIETQGAPLSRREKALLIARPLATMLVTFPLVYGALTYSRAYGLESIAFLVTIAVLLAFGVRQARRHQMPWTPTAKSIMGLICAHVFMSWLNLTTAPFISSGPFRNAFSLWNVVFMVGCIVLAIRARRETNTLRPWRSLPQYGQSPVAAEQAYRLSPRIGVVLGLTGIGIVAFINGAQYFGVWAGVGIFVLLAGFCAIVMRWLR